MHPVALRLGAVVVHTYPLALALAFAAAWAIARIAEPRAGLAARSVTGLVPAAVLGGIVGARLAYVASFPQLYSQRWWRAFELQTGGLVFYGGVAGGAIAVALVARARRLQLPAVADVAALSLPVASAVGRLGCFAEGCCGGPGLAVGGVSIPPQLLDALAQLALFGVLVAISRRTPLGGGTLAWWWVALYGATRFGIEYVRAEPVVALGATSAQLVSAAAVVVATAGLVRAAAKGGAW